ncbi:hypothetical protein [Streptomyces sp. NPDC088348]|uniref:hypothetical protein n=1 Tax=Streptomyces sp. NPDC088348 TaxID=3365853 RepID=UPI0037F5E6BF
MRQISRTIKVSHLTVSLALTRLSAVPQPDNNQPRLGERKDLPVTDEEIVRRYQAGATITELAELCGTKAHHTIRQRLHDHGVTEIRSGLTPGWNKAELPEQEIIDAYRAGDTTTALGRRYDVDRVTIRSLLLRAGVPLRKTGRAALTPAQQEEVIALYQQGVSERDIGAKFGVSRTPVQKLLEDRGVQRRHSRRKDDLPTAKIVQRLEAGETTAALAREYGVGRATITRRAQEYKEQQESS